MPNLLLTHRGVIGGEIFLHSLAVDSGVIGQDVAAAQANAAFRTAWEAQAALTGNFGDAVEYQEVTAAEILDLSAGTLTAASHAVFATDPPSGTGPTGAYQSTAAISLQAGVRPNGTPLRGRFYLPTISTTAQTDGRLGSSAIAALEAWVADWFTELTNVSLQPSVWSRSLGVVQPVTNVRLGDVIDTIRSRRNGLTENYTGISFP